MTGNRSILRGVQFAALLMASLCLCMTACGKGKGTADSATEPTAATEPSAAATEAESSVPETEAATEAPAPQTGAVYDEAGVLTPEAIRQVDAMLSELSVRYRISMAAVTTADLGGESPSAFAKAYFRSLYGKKAGGMLVLINNDTFEDYIYTAGRCSDYVSGAEKQLAIAAATPDLVEGKYTEAITALLSLCEQLPSHVFDESDMLTKAQISAIEEAAQGTSGRVCVLLTDAALSEDAAEETAEESAEDEAQKALLRAAREQCEALQADALLLIHTESKTCAVIGAEGKDALCEELQEILESDAESPFEDAAVRFYEEMADNTDT